MNTEVEQAKAALDQARADHTRALLAARDKPGDPQAQQQFRDAVRAGREAWRGYQEVATAGLAAQIKAIVHSDFQDTQE
jgi:hypothetical protein